MSVKFSVIIPAYNAEATIEKCLNSLITQPFDDYEIIVVNDGSTDKTEKICRVIAESNRHVTLVNKPNGGVSSARNIGLNIASGKYVLFVDSDDFVAENYFECIDSEINGFDFLLFGNYIKKHNQLDSVANISVETEAKNETVEQLAILLKAQKLNAPNNKVFKMSIIKNYKIRFDERLPIGEDKVFVVSYVQHIDKLKVSNRTLYYLVTENEESLSRKPRKGLYRYILLEHDLLFEAISGSNNSEEVKNVFKTSVSYSFYRSAYTVIFELWKLKLSNCERYKETKIICDEYRDKKIGYTKGLKHLIISLPIRFRAYLLLYIIISLKN